MSGTSTKETSCTQKSRQVWLNENKGDKNLKVSYMTNFWSMKRGTRFSKNFFKD